MSRKLGVLILWGPISGIGCECCALLYGCCIIPSFSVPKASPLGFATLTDTIAPRWELSGWATAKFCTESLIACFSDNFSGHTTAHVCISCRCTCLSFAIRSSMDSISKSSSSSDKWLTSKTGCSFAYGSVGVPSSTVWICGWFSLSSWAQGGDNWYKPIKDSMLCLCYFHSMQMNHTVDLKKKLSLKIWFYPTSDTNWDVLHVCSSR